MPKTKDFFVKRILFSKLFLIVGIFVLLLFSSALGREILNHHQLNKEISALEQEIETMENRHSQLTDLIAYYESPDFLEKGARLKLGLRKSGESVVVIPGIEDNTDNEINIVLSAGETKIDNKKDTINNINKWLEYFAYGR